MTTTGLWTFGLWQLVYRHLVYYVFPCWNRSWSDETNTISTGAGL